MVREGGGGGGRWLQGHNELGLHILERPQIYSFTAISSETYTFSHRHKLARLKEDGSRHPNLNLFLINRHSAGSAL